METNSLAFACYNAIMSGCLANMDQRWDIATAEMLRTSMLKNAMIPLDVTTDQIYHTMLPAFDIGTTETDHRPYSFMAPSKEELQQEGIDISVLDKEGEKHMARTYVKMEVVFDEQGKMEPTVLHWVNGKKFPIDKVTDVQNAAKLKKDSSGGAGIRYTCRIMEQERYLWFMEGKWFVESLA